MSEESPGAVVHRLGRAPSRSALSAYLRGLGLDYEIETLLRECPDVEVMRVLVAGDSRARDVVISRRKYRSITRQEVVAWLRPLGELGSPDERGRVLALALAAELHAVLALESYRVDYRGDDRREFVREQCADITIWGHGRMWDVEVRNRRSQWHEFALKQQDRHMVERNVRMGVVPVFVVPKCTPEWRAEAEALGAVVIETEMYVVASESHKTIWQCYGCEAWRTEVAMIAVPLIADMVTAALGFPGRGEDRAEGRIESSSDRREARRVVLRTNHHEVWERLIEMEAAGVTSMREAASELGISYRTAKRIVRKYGGSPWGRGGAGRGQGRKSKGHS